MAIVLFLSVILLIPSYAYGQTSTITLLDTFGDYKKGERIFIFGQVGQVSPDLSVVVQITNPNGDLCQIQQVRPLSNGHFITDTAPLSGRICGLTGNYQVKVFYGEFTKASTFQLLNEKYSEKSALDYYDQGANLIETKINSIKELTSPNQIVEFEDRLSQTTSSSNDAVLKLKNVYADLLVLHFDESDTLDVGPKFRPAVQTALESTNYLVDVGILDTAEAKKIDKQIFDAMFYSQIGDDKNTIGILNDVYVQIINADPQKIPAQQSLTYEELNSLLLNLMTKSNSIMSRPLQEQLGFIFARGTGPIYSEELNNLVDLLTKARTLDATLKSDAKLTSMIRAEWDVLRESLLGKESLEKFLEQKDRVDNLYAATLLLRNLDKVGRFVSSDDQQSELATLIEPRLNDLLSRLGGATSPDDIISVKQEILDMKNVIEISSRISSTIEFSKKNNANPQLVDSFESLLDQIKGANSLNEILSIVSEFDGTINELREKRNPLSVMKFDYEKLKTKAELQADYESLVTINTALKAINTAIDLEKGNPSTNKIDKIEVLLSWASANESQIQAKLDSYTKDAYKIRASDILQRAKSIENLAELGTTHNRFLPGYTDFTSSLKERLGTVRNLVLKNDLDGADNLVRKLSAEWQQVSKKYADDPFGSDVGYTVDEIKRIEYREKLAQLSAFATRFHNADFAEHSAEFEQLMQNAYDLVDYGNFVDADVKIKALRNFLSENLVLHNKKIIFDISYEPEKEIWVMSGALDKQIMGARQNLYLTVYDMDANVHSTLKFSDTRQGELFTQWYAPIEPGLYVVTLQWQDVQASQIVDVPEKSSGVYDPDDLKNVDMAREFEELQSFIDTFGSSGYGANAAKFDPVISEIKTALHNKDFSSASANLSELRGLIERYLPTRAPNAVIEAYVQDGKLYLSGAIQKTIAFSEDIYVDIYDQKGNRVDEIPLKDNASGYFNQVISKPYLAGTYVAQLEYHDLIVSDFFHVN
ncbi:hypothetical protein [Candidatus Nitrosotenuis chungbukensis]|uniref:hypothetical protein n=1 Tax=Candidatus Nitrosotenuis chungbukensis TaxID=1353246 RepID=UPI0012FEA8CA|nr:hypothetical protein [Candidatus Nitrosotenuis chungbukensis]